MKQEREEQEAKRTREVNGRHPLSVGQGQGCILSIHEYQAIAHYSSLLLLLQLLVVTALTKTARMKQKTLVLSISVPRRGSAPVVLAGGAICEDEAAAMTEALSLSNKPHPR